MPQQMVLGPWHEIWEAFLFYKSHEAADYDRLVNDGLPWPQWAQNARSSYAIHVGFAKNEANIWNGPSGWSHDFQANLWYSDVFECE